MVRLAPIFSKYYSNTRPPFLESLILNAKTPFLKTKFLDHILLIFTLYVYKFWETKFIICFSLLFFVILFSFCLLFFLSTFFVCFSEFFILWNLYLKAQSVLCNILCLYNLVAVRIYCDDEKLYAYCFYKRNQIEKKKLKY